MEPLLAIDDGVSPAAVITRLFDRPSSSSSSPASGAMSLAQASLTTVLSRSNIEPESGLAPEDFTAVNGMVPQPPQSAFRERSFYQRYIKGEVEPLQPS